MMTDAELLRHAVATMRYRHDGVESPDFRWLAVADLLAAVCGEAVLSSPSYRAAVKAARAYLDVPA